MKKFQQLPLKIPKIYLAFNYTKTLFKKNHFSDYQKLSFTIGIIYLWFGILKIFPNYSPAEGIAFDTIKWLTFNLIVKQTAIILLGIAEIAIGFLLIFYYQKRTVIQIALTHIFFTFLPLIIFPNKSFLHFPFGFSLIGQYIFKNIIIVSVLLILLNNTKQIAKEN